MKLGELAEFYYTAAEARKVLGIDQDTFQYWGKSERIRRIRLPGRKQAVYSRKEIDEMARKIEAVTLTERIEGLEFRKATINDLEEEYKLARIIFGRNADTAEIREGKRSFLKKNPNINYHLYDHGNFVGCIHVVPLKHEAIMTLLRERIPAWTLDPSNIEQFTPRKPIECFLLDMLTTPGVEPNKRSFYAGRMLVHLTEAMEEWGRQGIQIAKLYGMSRTPSGIRILRSAGFNVLEEQEDGRITFELDINASDERLFRGYKEALQQWNRQQDATSHDIAEKKKGK